ncbi:alpha/beta hydrolase [Flavobacterium soyangense]|uniref:Alpha/beta hydrolase n=1 Tax=Flavobacterium soyangense TaxID=2023265 RepID=A0A930Y0E3_9FLAO|nr:alpha/beta hydrolase [Flavobacterium soyangense]MBF2709863.1 alpha/beta hydrolase [Flavobacterium soyangense]
MKIKIFFCLMLLNSSLIHAQETIQLPFENPDNIKWENKEKEYYSSIWKAQVVTNVSTPSLLVYRPALKINNGTAVIIAPGGGFYGLSIKNEGTDVAEWLVKKGVTVFVLKYRLVPTAEDGAAEISKISESNHAKYLEEANKIIPYSIKDGTNAVAYVRKHSDDFGISKNKIGFMGFSAGGTVSLSVALNSSDESKIDFLVPVYTAASYFFPMQEPTKNAPPIFLVCASDDGFGLADDSIELYKLWHHLGINAELHMFARGYHGFGMTKSGQPKDKWIERFYEWALNENYIQNKK